MSRTIEEVVVKKAREFSAAAHAGQKRDNGTDYATHPHAAAMLLRERGLANTATLAARFRPVGLLASPRRRVNSIS